MAAEVKLLAEGVLLLEMQRPEARNALNLEMLRSINAGLGTHLRSGAVRSVLLRGAGGYFSAGADLKEMAEARAGGPEGRALLRQAMAELISLMTELRTLPVPTVALVEGGASGGGVGLAASCQYVVATERSSFALPETKIGLFPFIISPVLLRRLDLGAFLRLTFEGKPLPAAEAQKIGLVDEVLPQLPEPGELAQRAARPDVVWPRGTGGDVEAALAPFQAGLPPHQVRAARVAALLHESMSLPIAMRTAASELGALVERLGEGR